jgi:glycogen synthase
MNILLAASEMTPYAKTGGLGDVLAALPAALREQGHSVSVVLPLYRTLRKTLPQLQPTELTLIEMSILTAAISTVEKGAIILIMRPVLFSFPRWWWNWFVTSILSRS